jgi:catechol 2,3-dioxygenase-like lactoylglutathione lyase family enzyme
MAQPVFRLEKIGVVMLDVANLTRSVTFYRHQLGLALQQQFETFAFFAGGGVTLVLRETRAFPGGSGPGATEVVFSVADVRAAYEALRAQGVVFANEPRVVSGPMWGANFSDPDGHRLSLFGPERKS